MKNQIISQVKDAISILKLDKVKMQEVAARNDATKWGIIILVVPTVLNVVLASLNFPSGFSVIFSRFLLWPLLVPLFAMVGSIVVMSFVAQKFFKGQGSHIGFFRTIAYSSVVLWVTVIPFILALLGFFDAFGLYNLIWVVAVIWMFVVSYQMLLIHHKLTQENAAIVIVAGIVGYFLLRYLFGELLVGSSYRIFY